MSKQTEHELRNVLRWLRMAERKADRIKEERCKDLNSDWWARIAQGEADAFNKAAEYIERKLRRLKS